MAKYSKLPQSCFFFQFETRILNFKVNVISQGPQYLTALGLIRTHQDVNLHVHRSNGCCGS